MDFGLFDSDVGHNFVDGEQVGLFLAYAVLAHGVKSDGVTGSVPTSWHGVSTFQCLTEARN